MLVSICFFFFYFASGFVFDFLVFFFLAFACQLQFATSGFFFGDMFARIAYPCAVNTPHTQKHLPPRRVCCCLSNFCFHSALWQFPRRKVMVSFEIFVVFFLSCFKEWRENFLMMIFALFCFCCWCYNIGWSCCGYFMQWSEARKRRFFSFFSKRVVCSIAVQMQFFLCCCCRIVEMFAL